MTSSRRMTILGPGPSQRYEWHRAKPCANTHDAVERDQPAWDELEYRGIAYDPTRQMPALEIRQCWTCLRAVWRPIEMFKGIDLERVHEQLSHRERVRRGRWIPHPNDPPSEPIP